MSVEGILPCPACGDKANVYDYQAMSAVYCEDCGVRGPLGETEAEAIAAWNAMPRRPQVSKSCNHPSALHERIWNAIVAPPCTRCMARADWHPADCAKNGCHDLYAQEVAAVMEIFEQELAARCPQVIPDKEDE